MRSHSGSIELGSVLTIIQRQLSGKPIVLWANAGFLVLFLLIGLYAKFIGHGSQVVWLFGSPFNVEHPYFGMLTTLGNLLLCASTAICAFTAAILNRLNPERKPDGFIACFGCVIGVITIDRMFRITTILKYIGSPVKLMMYAVYGVLVLAFGLAFRRRLSQTPYILPLASALLLVIGGLVDLAPTPGIGAPAMLEEGSTLIACLNLSFYFWITCQRELFRNVKHGARRLSAQP